MKPTLHIAIAVVVAAHAAGCRLCADCDEFAYPTYGGAWQRLDREHGRVGSVFAPAGARSAELVERDQPPAHDELEREQGDLYPPLNQEPFEFENGGESSQDSAPDPDNPATDPEETPPGRLETRREAPDHGTLR